MFTVSHGYELFSTDVLNLNDENEPGHGCTIQIHSSVMLNY